MEMLRGRTLDDEIARRGRFELEAGLAVLEPALEAVEAAHCAGVIHRDLKPQNIMLEPADAGPVVKVLDFGLAKLLDPNTVERGIRSISGTIVGTPHFMCPEQCEGRPLDRRSDVYSLGCILFVVLTGRPPFDGDSLAGVLLKHLDDAPPAPSAVVPSLPGALDEVLLRALAKKPADRYQTVADLGADLARVRSSSRV
jgi:serine/threonine protein kinase